MEQLKTLWYEEDTDSIAFIDETLLPGSFEIRRCTTVFELGTAIKTLAIRGAPALGVAGALGVALGARRSKETRYEQFCEHVQADANMLSATRPTAVNLSWGVQRVLSSMREAGSIHEAKEAALSEALAVAREDAIICRRIGQHGAALLPARGTVLTHCNAGALACSEWGTALGVIRSAVEAGKDIRVIACETRPLLQGARLTAWELFRDHIDVTVITDSMAATLMRKGEIGSVIVGADRITRDAVFNKIGTYMHAVCAKYHSIPFYVAAPVSTFDFKGMEADIIVEERGREEVASFFGRNTIPDGVPVKNPGFDATPLALVSAIVTERGVLSAPYDMGQIVETVEYISPG
jgi:methylthioribose-1-phosphate isomerase